MRLFKTSDLCDDNREKNIQVLPPKFLNFGGKRVFKGQIRTISIDKSNFGLIEFLKKENGRGKVLVVDAKEVFYGIVGDRLSLLAEKAGFEAIILNGYVRDTTETRKFNLALLALGSCPFRSFEETKYETKINLSFANVTFIENDYMYGDEDSIIICSEKLAS